MIENLLMWTYSKIYFPRNIAYVSGIYASVGLNYFIIIVVEILFVKIITN